MPRYESTTQKFVNDNVIKQVPGTGPVGPAGSATFPITYDDGTLTYSLTATSLALGAAVVDDGDANRYGQFAAAILGTIVEAGIAATSSASHSATVDLFADSAADTAQVELSAASIGNGYLNLILNGQSGIAVNDNGNYAQVRVGSGDPNGMVTQSVGSLFVDWSTPALWQNTDGATAWSQVGTPAVPPTVTGSRGGNVALASLLTALANLGLIVDSST